MIGLFGWRSVFWIAGCVAVVAAPRVALAQTNPDPVRPRVRSSHAYIRAMIDEAAQRSATFRSLVQAIDETDGIVYVEHGNCPHRRPACLTMSMTASGEQRFLRILVDARQPDWEVMSSIGHELRHALEVLNEAGVKSTAAVILFYFREGMTLDDTFETTAAIKAGNAVKNEVVSFSKRR